MIYGKFLGNQLTGEEQKLLKQIDDDLLYFDLRELLNEPQDKPEPEIHIELNYNFVPFEEVEQKYLELYEKWRAM